MKKYTLLGAFAITSMLGDNYLEIKSGLCTPSKKDGISYKTGPFVSGEIGHRFKNFHVGFQWGYLKYKNKEIKDDTTKHYGEIFTADHDYVNSCFSSVLGLVNIYYDYKLDDNVALYAGIGAGIAKLKYHFKDVAGNVGDAGLDCNLSKTVWCAQMMVGVLYDINDHWALSLGYSCMKLETVYFDNCPDLTLVSSLKTPYLHSLELGLRYSF